MLIELMLKPVPVLKLSRLSTRREETTLEHGGHHMRSTLLRAASQVLGKARTIFQYARRSSIEHRKALLTQLPGQPQQEVNRLVVPRSGWR